MNGSREIERGVGYRKYSEELSGHPIGYGGWFQQAGKPMMTSQNVGRSSLIPRVLSREVINP